MPRTRLAIMLSWLGMLCGAVLLSPLLARAADGLSLVKDINPQLCAGPSVQCDSQPAGIVEIDGTLFFTAFQPSTGRELWKSDGTDAGTVLVADVSPSGLAGYAKTDHALYFLAHDYSTGESTLWKIDAHADVPVRLADVVPISPMLDGPTLKGVGDTLLFTDAFSLWVTDGTAGGTMKLADFPGHSDFSRWNFTEVGESVFFTVCEPGGDCELWKTDRTPSGTERVKVVRPPYGPGDPVAQPDAALFALTNLDGTLFFSACQQFRSCDLWRSDGTAQGTILIAQYVPNPPSNDDWNLPTIGIFGGQLFFRACEPTSGCELWTSDGTAAGTHLFVDMNPSGSSFGNHEMPEFVSLPGGLLFFANGDELWRTDGTAAGTEPLSPGVLGSLTPVGDIALFDRRTDQGGLTLWMTDGTLEGTGPAIAASADWRPTTSPDAVASGGRIYIAASDAVHGQELWSFPVPESGSSTCTGQCPDAESSTTTSTTATSSTVATTSTTTTSTTIATISTTSTSTTIATSSTTSTSTTQTSTSLTTSTVPRDSSDAPSVGSGCARMVTRLRPLLSGLRCESSGKGQNRRRAAFRRIVVRAVQRRRVSHACAHDLLGLIPKCSSVGRD